MPIKVFISHKRADADVALRVAHRVQSRGLETYVDLIDDALVKDGPGLADHLLRRLSDCQQLIAVVSEETKTSWWVPWEIGVGSEKGFRMASFCARATSLPSYLVKWPVLKTLQDVDLYCSYSRTSEQRVFNRTLGELDPGRRTQLRKSETFDFHRTLMSAL